MVKTFGPLKVGFIGLYLNTSEISEAKLTHTRLGDPLEAAAQYVPILKREGATVIVAVTHLAFATDRALVEALPDIDLIIGGHEHYPITSTENRTLISKAGSDAKWVARIDVNRVKGTVERFYELIPITNTLPDEPRTAAVVNEYESRLGPALETIVGATRPTRRQQRAPARGRDEPRRPVRRRHPRGRRCGRRDYECRQHSRRSHLPRRPVDDADAPRDAPVRQRDLKARGPGTRHPCCAEPWRVEAAGERRPVPASVWPDDEGGRQQGGRLAIASPKCMWAGSRSIPTKPTASRPRTSSSKVAMATRCSPAIASSRHLSRATCSFPRSKRTSPRRKRSRRRSTAGS